MVQGVGLPRALNSRPVYPEPCPGSQVPHRRPTGACQHWPGSQGADMELPGLSFGVEGKAVIPAKAGGGGWGWLWG